MGDILLEGRAIGGICTAISRDIHLSPPFLAPAALALFVNKISGGV